MYPPLVNKIEHGWSKELGGHTKFLVMVFLLNELIHSLSIRDIHAIVYHVTSVGMIRSSACAYDVIRSH